MLVFVLDFLPKYNRFKSCGKSVSPGNKAISYLPKGESLFTLFALINICLSLSDDANKIKTLNIERA